MHKPWSTDGSKTENQVEKIFLRGTFWIWIVNEYYGVIANFLRSDNGTKMFVHITTKKQSVYGKMLSSGESG